MCPIPQPPSRPSATAEAKSSFQGGHLLRPTHRRSATGPCCGRCGDDAGPAAQVHRLATAEQAQAEYERKHKKAAPTGGASFSQKTLYKAYERRTEEMPYTLVRSATQSWSFTSTPAGECQLGQEMLYKAYGRRAEEKLSTQVRSC